MFHNKPSLNFLGTCSDMVHPGLEGFFPDSSSSWNPMTLISISRRRARRSSARRGSSLLLSNIGMPIGEKNQGPEYIFWHKYSFKCQLFNLPSMSSSSVSSSSFPMAIPSLLTFPPPPLSSKSHLELVTAWA